EWTAIHRKHHTVCETEDDPHSPQIYGLNRVVARAAELYGLGMNPETLDRFGRGTPDDWVERNVYRTFKSGGLVLMAIVDIVLFGAIGLTVWAVQMIWIPFFAAGVINGIGHYWGYRNFECPDAARNIVPWAILIGGEELHNNHHTYPNSAKLSVKPWEFDMGWFWIKLFSARGLARVLSTGPIVERIAGRSVVDMDTVWAVLNDRFRVMAKYAERVVAPLVEQEYHRADVATRALIKRAKALLVREETLVDAAGHADLSKIVDLDPMLQRIYTLRRQLLAGWAKRGGQDD